MGVFDASKKSIIQHSITHVALYQIHGSQYNLEKAFIANRSKLLHHVVLLTAAVVSLMVICFDPLPRLLASKVEGLIHMLCLSLFRALVSVIC